VADYTMASPSPNCDIPQTFLEPILIGHAASRGSRIRFDTEYLGLTQDAYVWHRPSVMYWIGHRRHRHGLGPHGPTVERVADRLGLRHQPATAGRGRRNGHPDRVRTGRRRHHPGDIRSTSLWGNNKMYATSYRSGRVFCMGQIVLRANKSIEEFGPIWPAATAATAAGPAIPLLAE
jgi:hypothetical protein